MSTLNVSNITDGTTTVGTSYVVNGSAKAWVNFNGTGTIAARDSLNVSSLTDNGTGDYTRTVSSAFGNANYSTSGGGGLTSTSVGSLSHHPNAAPTTTAFRCQAANFAMSGLLDWTYVEINSFGDLA